MPIITLTEEQAKVITQATEDIEIRDPTGATVATIPPFWTSEDIEIASQRAQSDEPRYTTVEVLDYLRSLESK